MKKKTRIYMGRAAIILLTIAGVLLMACMIFTQTFDAIFRKLGANTSSWFIEHVIVSWSKILDKAEDLAYKKD